MTGKASETRGGRGSRNGTVQLDKCAEAEPRNGYRNTRNTKKRHHKHTANRAFEMSKSRNAFAFAHVSIRLASDQSPPLLLTRRRHRPRKNKGPAHQPPSSPHLRPLSPPPPRSLPLPLGPPRLGVVRGGRHGIGASAPAPALLPSPSPRTPCREDKPYRPVCPPPGAARRPETRGSPGHRADSAPRAGCERGRSDASRSGGPRTMTNESTTRTTDHTRENSHPRPCGPRSARYASRGKPRCAHISAPARASTAHALITPARTLRLPPSPRSPPGSVLRVP